MQIFQMREVAFQTCLQTTGYPEERFVCPGAGSREVDPTVQLCYEYKRILQSHL